MFLSLIMLFACQAPGDQSAQSAGESSEDQKIQGQAAVQDEESSQNILQVAINSDAHSTLVAGVQAAELENVLVNAGPLTVFAPTNEAFDQLPEGTLDELLKPENKSKLARIIKYHAAPGNYTTDMLNDGQRLFQASGHYVTISKENGKVSVEGANIIGSVEASNGIVHVIDKVILPPDE